MRQVGRVQLTLIHQRCVAQVVQVPTSEQERQFDVLLDRVSAAMEFREEQLAAAPRQLHLMAACFSSISILQSSCGSLAAVARGLCYQSRTRQQMESQNSMPMEADECMAMLMTLHGDTCMPSLFRFAV